MRLVTNVSKDPYKAIALSEVFAKSVLFRKSESIVVLTKISECVILAQNATIRKLDENYLTMPNKKEIGKYPIARVVGTSEKKSIGILGHSWGLGLFLKRGDMNVTSNDDMKALQLDIWQSLVSNYGIELEISNNDLLVKNWSGENKKISGGLFRNLGLMLVGYSSLVEKHPSGDIADKIFKGTYNKRVVSFEEITGKSLNLFAINRFVFQYFKSKGVDLQLGNALNKYEKKTFKEAYEKQVNPDWVRYGRKRWLKQ